MKPVFSFHYFILKKMNKNSTLLLTVLITLLFASCNELRMQQMMPVLDDYWSEARIEKTKKNHNYHDLGPEKYHFPRKAFLASGYCTEGGYVKDFSILQHDNRWHVFHIDGRPGETCWITGNEISFGHASTNDFNHWIRHEMPLSIGDSEFQNKHIWAPFIHETDSLFYMFYNGQGSAGNYISIAYSTDLDNWKKTQTPIEEAPGRDPFVFEQTGQTYLLYTYETKIGACSSSDCKTWVKHPDVIQLPEGAPESCSIHKVGDRYLLWFNGWNMNKDSKMHAMYAFSDSILDFTKSELKEINFQYSKEFTKVNQSFIIEPNNICPISIEKIAGDNESLFVCYFRPQLDRYKLFFGEMNIAKEPITIREINNEKELNDFLKKINLIYLEFL